MFDRLSPSQGSDEDRGPPLRSRLVGVYFVLWGVLVGVTGILSAVRYRVPGLIVLTVPFAAVTGGIGYGIRNRRQWGWYGGIVMATLFGVLSLSLGAHVLLGVLLVLNAASIAVLWADRRAFEERVVSRSVYGERLPRTHWFFLVMLGTLGWIGVLVTAGVVSEDSGWMYPVVLGMCAVWIALPVGLYWDASVVEEYTDWSPHRGLYAVASLLWYVNVLVGAFYLYRRWQAGKRVRARAGPGA